MTRTGTIIAAAAVSLIATGCSSRDTSCLPTGEKAVVLRSGTAEGYRFVTVRRKNGEEVTCTGKNTPALLQEGDEIDGATLTRADATHK